MNVWKAQIEIRRAAERDVLRVIIVLGEWNPQLACIAGSSSQRLGSIGFDSFILAMFSICTAQLGIGHLTYLILRSGGALLAVTLTK